MEPHGFTRGRMSDTGLSSRSLDRVIGMIGDRFTWMDCSLSLAQELVYGSVAWARKHGFRTPPETMRCLEVLPPPENEPDVSRFGGKVGRPVLIGDLAALMRFVRQR